MMTLAQLWPERLADHATLIQAISLDSRQVSEGTLFFALKGTLQPERVGQFVADALARGAVAVITEVEVAIQSERPIIVAPDLRAHLGSIARRFYQANPAVQPLRVAAVTGTNGKTTISRLIAELLSAAGHPSAVMGTTGNGILPNLSASTHTTLDALSLQQHLYAYAVQGAQYACLEASSHGLDQGRLQGTPIEVAVFSNLTRDHLDYHGTFEAYAAAKAKLFEFPELHTAILNADDPAYLIMQRACASHVRVWTYSMDKPFADFALLSARYTLQGADLQIKTPLGMIEVHSPLLGRFNVSNLLAAMAAACALGLNLSQMIDAVPQLKGAAGRMQVIEDPERLLLVDYAHTPDALEQVLHSVRPHVAGQLWVVFGCGGDRDRGKRPLMTQAALSLADRVILTADNPRSEAVEAILEDMLTGAVTAKSQQLTVQPDRREAIRFAVAHSQAGDAVVVAGKGHEDYQEIQGVRHWFDDAVELAQAKIARPTHVVDALSPPPH
jgi:UDP-N-acetylmuramoyl-L-alanyl-D-glutamate--2,6-diaminopimelate ligase